MKLTFRIKAVLYFSPIIVCLSLVYTWLSIDTQRHLLRTEIIERGETLAVTAAKSAELPILSENHDLLQAVSKSLQRIKHVPFVTLYNLELKELVHAGKVKGSKPPKALASESLTVTLEQHDFFEFFAPVFSLRASTDIDVFHESPSAKESQELIGWVQIGLSKEVITKAEKRVISEGLVFAVVFTIGFIILVIGLINVATRPLTALFDAVKGLREGEYPEIKGVNSNDEIGLLAQEFGRMTSAIKDREQRLRDSEKRVKELFSRVDHAIFQLDHEFNIIEANKVFLRHCGEVKNLSAIFRREQRELIKTASAGALINKEETLIDRLGNELYVIMSLYPERDDEARITGYDGYFVDITVRKHLERTLFQAQKLDSLGLLAGGIAHDFNNILTGIMGYSTLLKSVLTPASGEAFRFLDNIDKSAGRAANLTKQLLGFARLGKFEIRAVNVNDLVVELREFLRETFNRSISVTLRIAPYLPSVMADANQIYQTILNLCINARDAMPDGGRLLLKTEHCVFDRPGADDTVEIPKGQYVRLVVADTGMGMPPEVKSRIFEPFYTTKGIGKGTGLGLSMSYGIIQNHGGFIAIHTLPDLGTSFHIYLPEMTEEDGDDITKPETKDMGSEPARKTILLIDDEEVVRELCRDILEAYDYRVLLAPHGGEGVRIFAEQKDAIDLVILDMIMPKKNGRETFHEIRRIRPGAKVLLCSGFGDEHTFKELLDAGATRLVRKPFGYTELVAAVEDVLAGKTSNSEVSR